MFQLGFTVQACRVIIICRLFTVSTGSLDQHGGGGAEAVRDSIYLYGIIIIIIVFLFYLFSRDWLWSLVLIGTGCQQT